MIGVFEEEAGGPRDDERFELAAQRGFAELVGRGARGVVREPEGGRREGERCAEDAFRDARAARDFFEDAEAHGLAFLAGQLQRVAERHHPCGLQLLVEAALVKDRRLECLPQRVRERVRRNRRRQSRRDVQQAPKNDDVERRHLCRLDDLSRAKLRDVALEKVLRLLPQHAADPLEILLHELRRRGVVPGAQLGAQQDLVQMHHHGDHPVRLLERVRAGRDGAR
mmetsp:Transcript_15971/g.41043  ORF Transcript_15971/g.41043 Transcript_15971/m.41043 type:complete len:225 (+) Transcript_15971:434-1108(+)